MSRPYPHLHGPTVLVTSPVAHHHRSLSGAPALASPPPPTQANQPFSKSYNGSTRSRRGFDISAATTTAAASAEGKAWSAREREWMIGSTAAEVERVATGSTNNRISRAAVVDSLRDATKTLDAAMAASVQSAALSQLQAGDAKGNVSREEVARVWLTNVLPALERAPARDASGSLATRKLTERLHRMMHGRLSQVMLDELPAAQDALGLAIDPVGGGELPTDLVQPLVATLTAAALRATVHELGDALLSLPGLEGLAQPAIADDADAAPHSPTSHPTSPNGISAFGVSSLSLGGGGGGSKSSVSQAEALGAAEGLVRRMLEGALHGHHSALALAEADGEYAAGHAPSSASPLAPGSPIASGRTILKLREAEATVERLVAEKAQLAGEHAVLVDEHREVCNERNALLAANRQLDAELDVSHGQNQAAAERSAELTDELTRAFHAREAVEADLTELRANVQTQVVNAVEASQQAARRAFDSDVRHDRSAIERELSVLRARCDAETAAAEELRLRCEALELEKTTLAGEKAALLAQRTANSTRDSALASLALATSPMRDGGTLPLSPRADARTNEAVGEGEATAYGGWKPTFVSPVEVKL